MTDLSAVPGWHTGLRNTQALYAEHGTEAEDRAVAFADVYRGQRAVMVFDVVASRQRRFNTRVRSMIDAFSAAPQAASLQALADHGPPSDIALRTGEGDTMAQVAAGLVRYCREHALDEDAGVHAWAVRAEPFVHASKMEPYVGHVKGMGTALFAYLRMRCGANAIKPDLRVHAAFNALGFTVPNDPHALLVLASAVSEETGISLLALDQLLWWQDERRPSPTPPLVPSGPPQNALTLTVPGPNATADELLRLAATIDGYMAAGPVVLGKIGNAIREEWQDHGVLPNDLSLLRLALFIDYRRWHHYGEPPTERNGLPYQRALADAIRALTPTVPIEPGTWMAQEGR